VGNVESAPSESDASTTLVPSNTAPAAADDGYTINEDAVLTVIAPGVLGNDTAGEGDPLTASLVTPPIHGILGLNPDGSFTYTPAKDYFGPDAFTYQANDGLADSNVATVALTIIAVNDPPAFTKGPDQTVLEDAGPPTVASWATAIIAGPANEAGQTLTFLVSTDTPELFTTPPAITPEGTLTYTPAPDANGSTLVTVQVQDDGGTADGGMDTSPAQVFSLTILAMNDPPVNTVPGNQVAAEDTALVFSTGNGNPVSVADVDAGSNPVQVTLTATNRVLTLGGTAGLTFTTGDGTADPTLTFTGPLAAINAALDGLVFQPTPDFHGLGNLEITTDDLGNTGAGGPQSVTNTVAITVTPVNDAPVAQDNAYTVDEDTVLTVPATGVLGNDTDADGDILHARLVQGPVFGALTLNEDGSFTYTPGPDFNGQDLFAYVAGDGQAESVPALVAIGVTPVNDAPTAVAKGYTLDEDTSLTVAGPGVLGNAHDVEGDSLSAHLVTPPGHGTVVLDPVGSFTYTPPPELPRDRQLHLRGERWGRLVRPGHGDPHSQQRR